MTGPKGFLVILPGQIIEIPQDSNLAWLRMFYTLPKALVEKRPEFLRMLRNIRRSLNSETHRPLLESDSLLDPVEHNVEWLAYQKFGNFLGDLTEEIVREQN